MADIKFSSLKTRIRTAAILAIILCTVLAIGQTAVFYFICLVSCLAQWEFLSFFYQETKDRNFKLFYCALGFLMIFLGGQLPALSPLFGLGTAALVSSFVALWKFNHENACSNMKKAGIGMLSCIYLPLIFGFMSKFTLPQQLMVALIPIASDTFAYFAGISFGKRKIWVTVSPKKSVEGCIVGLVAAILVLLYFAYAHNVVSTSLPVLILCGIILGVLAQLGDFFESALKRTVNIKDSGTILPGHGGVLDRTDSLIFTIAGFEIFTLILNAF